VCESLLVSPCGEVFGAGQHPSAWVRGRKAVASSSDAALGSSPRPAVMTRVGRVLFDITDLAPVTSSTQQASLAASAAPVGGSPERTALGRIAAVEQTEAIGRNQPAGPLKALARPLLSTFGAEQAGDGPPRPAELAPCAGAARRTAHEENHSPTPRRKQAACSSALGSSQRALAACHR